MKLKLIVHLFRAVYQNSKHAAGCHSVCRRSCIAGQRHNAGPGPIRPNDQTILPLLRTNQLKIRHKKQCLENFAHYAGYSRPQAFVKRAPAPDRNLRSSKEHLKAGNIRDGHPSRLFYLMFSVHTSQKDITRHLTSVWLLHQPRHLSNALTT